MGIILTFFPGCIHSSESICSNGWWVSNTLQVLNSELCNTISRYCKYCISHKLFSCNNQTCCGHFRFSHASKLLQHEKTFHFRHRVLFLNETIFDWRLPLIAHWKVSLMRHRMRVWLFLSYRQLLPGVFWRLPRHTFLQRRKYIILALCVVFFAPSLLQWPFTLFAGKIWQIEQEGTIRKDVCDV